MTGKTKSVIQPKNNEIIFKIRKPDSGAIFGWALLFIFLYFLTYFVANSYAKGNGLPVRDLIKPQKWFEIKKISTDVDLSEKPTETLIPSLIPTTRPKVRTKTTYTNNQTNQIDCNGPDGKYFKTTEVECKKFNDAWGTKIVNNTPLSPNNLLPTRQPGISIEEYNRQAALIKIDCSYHYGDYNYDYGQLTYDDCRVKSNAYFDARKAAIPTYTSQTTSIPVPAGKSQTEIDKCKSEVTAKYDDLMRGCSVLYGATSVERECQIIYGNQKNTALQACN